jgi:hypothetical protein
MEEEGFFFADLGGDAKQDRGIEDEAFDMQEVLGKQAVCFAGVELVILQGGEQVKEDVGMRGSGGAFKQVQGLVGGEGAAEEEAFCSFLYISAASADFLGNAVGGKAVACIEDGERSALSKFGKQGWQDVGDIQCKDKFAGLKCGEKVHACTIQGMAERRNPLLGIFWGNTLGEADMGELKEGGYRCKVTIARR